MNYKYCNECPAMKRVNEPDPHDSFCDDDEGRYCQHADDKKIEGMCRPYEKTNVPDWCPLKQGGK